VALMDDGIDGKGEWQIRAHSAWYA